MVHDTNNRPQQTTALTQRKEYLYGRPQSPFVIQPPEEPGFDDELIEETTGVFDFMIYNESGGGNDGKVLISTTPFQATSLIAVEEVTDVFDQLVYEETTGVFGNCIERGG